MPCWMPTITTLIMLVLLVIYLILHLKQIKKEFYIFWVDTWYGVEKFKEN
jgi:hypothetical protein